MKKNGARRAGSAFSYTDGLILHVHSPKFHIIQQRDVAHYVSKM